MTPYYWVHLIFVNVGAVPPCLPLPQGRRQDLRKLIYPTLNVGAISRSRPYRYSANASVLKSNLMFLNDSSKSEISETLQKCFLSIDAHGELPAYSRQQIYETIEKDSSPPTFGHYKRAMLELKCAKKVLPKWQACELTDDSARKLLDLAEEGLQGQIDAKYLGSMSRVN